MVSGFGLADSRIFRKGFFDMDCEPDCTKLEWDEGWWCLRFNRFLGTDNPSQKISDCESDATENQKINKRDDDRKDMRLFRSIDNES